MEPDKIQFLGKDNAKNIEYDLIEDLDTGDSNKVSEGFTPDFSLYTGLIKDPVLAPNETEKLMNDANSDCSNYHNRFKMTQSANLMILGNHQNKNEAMTE